MRYEIESASYEDIASLGFALAHEDNDGEILVAVDEQGEIQGFLQHEGSHVRFTEALKPGAGMALIAHMMSEFDYLVAEQCCEAVWPLMRKLKFEPVGGSARGLACDWEWWSE